ncbi:hypothetical protein J6590_010578 [Homalodisca vitripennis]|nr:hypothetical protein J6590_010578 [Homalodisca vitripennis]
MEFQRGLFYTQEPKPKAFLLVSWVIYTAGVKPFFLETNALGEGNYALHRRMEWRAKSYPEVRAFITTLTPMVPRWRLGWEVWSEPAKHYRQQNEVIRAETERSHQTGNEMILAGSSSSSISPYPPHPP